jgi:hypothetical protein
MIVNSYNVEFGYELLTAIPYAYYLHTQGLLTGTISGKGSEALYYFSPDHRINPERRCWSNMSEFRKSGMPNVWIHRPELNTDQFAVPPYREQFSHVIQTPEKPIVCICNRYNDEWNTGGPINYFDLECLDRLFGMLKEKYTVIYWVCEIPLKLRDEANPLKMNDREMIRSKHPEVIIFQDLLRRHKKYDWNTLQLGIFSKCHRFITMNGGYSILASYFGGVNIIYSKKCSEINPKINSFYRWYHKLGGSRIVHTPDYEGLYGWVDDCFVKEKPLVNILLRTSGRPNFFNECMRSIREQTYKNVNVIVGTDDEQSARYVQPYKVIHVKYKPNVNVPDAPEDFADGRSIYGAKAHYNTYLNHLAKEVRSGWVLYMDDDGRFASRDSLADLVKEIRTDDDMIIPRVKVLTQVIPTDEYFGIPPVNCQITGAWLFHSKYLPFVNWEPYRKGNYRVARVLYKLCKPRWVNMILTHSDIVGNGIRTDVNRQQEKLYL